MAIVMDGKALALEVRKNVKIKVDQLKEEHGTAPHLVVILIGNDPASETYVSGKEKACQKAGIKSTVIRKQETIESNEVIELINNLNNDSDVHGILLQLPLPKHLDQNKIISRIDPLKDV
ncbi:MAG: tetrahydrofolate dehydrogenase/cyclohydrolase catalytic domain-containing protein, partial [Candidatus Izemoplasmatales bacterium]|nr:tetrahydrofolate dehydrogenase/cyclohydrolase catalytic domain-containing protein [Candidatus Izemoplasmatales bacterium]